MEKKEFRTIFSEEKPSRRGSLIHHVDKQIFRFVLLATEIRRICSQVGGYFFGAAAAVWHFRAVVHAQLSRNMQDGK